MDVRCAFNAAIASLVSICMPSYNYARFLPTAVESVLAQSHEALELLIVDNGSTDGSFDIAREFAVQDDRVRVLTHPGHENRGVNASLNLGLDESRGAYFGLLPADDLCLGDGLARRAMLLDAESDAGFVYGTAEVLDVDGRATGRTGGRAPNDMLRFDATNDLLQALLFHDFVPGAALLARRELLLELGGFDEAVFFNDWYLTIRLLARSTCAFVPGAPVVGYRLHERHADPDNLAADRPRKLELFRALSHYADLSHDRLGEPRVRALIALQRALHASRLGEPDEPRRAVEEAFRADPSLGLDGEYLRWWLDSRHGDWSLQLDTDERVGFLRALATPSASVSTVLSSGSEQSRFAGYVLDASGNALTGPARLWAAWALVAEQLEALQGKANPRIVFALAIRAVRQPSLLRLEAFAKTMLCAAGLWSFAAAARRRAAGLRRTIGA